MSIKINRDYVLLTGISAWEGGWKPAGGCEWDSACSGLSCDTNSCMTNHKQTTLYHDSVSVREDSVPVGFTDSNEIQSLRNACKSSQLSMNHFHCSLSGFLHFWDIQKAVECFCLYGFQWYALGDFSGGKNNKWMKMSGNMCPKIHNFMHLFML